MNNKPDESTLISYMYGELGEKEKERVEKYFHENPDELKHIQQLKGVTDLMGLARDKEVIAPPLFMDEDPRVIPFWKGTTFRTIASIAASFLVVVAGARLLGTDVSYSQGELKISFGTEKKIVTPANENLNLTAAQVQEMIDAAVKKNQETITVQLAANKTELDATIRRTMASNTAQINQLVAQASTASRTEVRSFVANLERDNLQQMRDYLQLSAADQRKYTDNLIVEFTRWLQEQRSQDLNMFQARLSSVEQNTDNLKEETEQILASIISNTSDGPRQIKN